MRGCIGSQNELENYIVVNLFDVKTIRTAPSSRSKSKFILEHTWSGRTVSSRINPTNLASAIILASVSSDVEKRGTCDKISIPFGERA
mmetsp:Transcript_13075/g.17087  ORF Transcript_13075/g.17087 Transcript_13075/m.17087 type:complete len:88 (+) Transcript_13075:2-265(+)